MAIYLLNQSGGLDNKSFMLGSTTISWDGNEMLFTSYYAGQIKIIFAKDNPNNMYFDTQEVLLDMLTARENFQKEQENLQKQAQFYKESDGDKLLKKLWKKNWKIRLNLM